MGTSTSFPAVIIKSANSSTTKIMYGKSGVHFQDLVFGP
jgi:hypothetical protein